MIMRSLQPNYARHLIRVPIMDYRALLEPLYSIEDGMVQGLWSDSSAFDSKGKKPSRSVTPQKYPRIFIIILLYIPGMN